MQTTTTLQQIVIPIWHALYVILEECRDRLHHLVLQQHTHLVLAGGAAASSLPEDLARVLRRSTEASVAKMRQRRRCSAIPVPKPARHCACGARHEWLRSGSAWMAPSATVVQQKPFVHALRTCCMTIGTLALLVCVMLMNSVYLCHRAGSIHCDSENSRATLDVSVETQLA